MKVKAPEIAIKRIILWIKETYPHAVIMRTGIVKSGFEADRNSEYGLRRYHPSILIFNSNDRYNGLVIEVVNTTTGYFRNGNVVPADIRGWLNDLYRMNWHVCSVASKEEAMPHVIRYFSTVPEVYAITDLPVKSS